MLNKKDQRIRRSRQTRARIAVQRVARLTVHRTNLHIYASVISEDGARIVASASTVEKEVREQLKNGGNAAAAAVVGKRFAYHGRVKALADAAREAGLQF
jgi:large subunit ribosomal protein L18